MKLSSLPEWLKNLVVYGELLEEDNIIDWILVHWWWIYVCAIVGVYILDWVVLVIIA